MLSKHTYFKLGGPADVFTVASNTEELEHAVSVAHRLKIPFFVLGGGSNILVGDLGVRGLVVKNEARAVTRSGNTVLAESGALLNQVASFAIEHGLSGLEPFMSVPGTVGGAVFNNSHFSPQKGDLIGNVIREAVVLFDDGTRTVDHQWFRFRYDYSRLHDTPGVIVSVTFGLTPGNTEELRKNGRDALTRRNEHQPVGLPCSGCIFRNTPQSSAGKLIDEAGLKGFSVGGAVVSEKHANFIINSGRATVHDVLELMERIQNSVKKATGVTLTPEIFLVGEFQYPPAAGLTTSWRHLT